MKPILILWLWTGLALYGTLCIILFRVYIRKRSAEIVSKFDDTIILSSVVGANFLGIESKGPWQMRGNGVLVLTSKELYFEMWVPKRIIKLPLSAVKEVSSAFTHAGNSKGVPLLKVRFQDDDVEDVVAWLVDDVAHWKRVLEDVINIRFLERRIHPMLKWNLCRQ